MTGIYRDKTIAEKSIYILNDNTQNNHFFRLQFVETFLTLNLTNQSIKIQVVKPTNKKTLL